MKRPFACSSAAAAAAAAISMIHNTFMASAITPSILNPSMPSIEPNNIVHKRQLFTSSSSSSSKRILPTFSSCSYNHPLAFVTHYGIARTTNDIHRSKFVRPFSSSTSKTSKNEKETTTTTTKSSTEYATTYHAPVMPNECISALLKCHRSQSDQKASPLIFIDGTLGGGGHSLALLQSLGAGDVVIGCDVDPNALREASERLREYMVVQGGEKNEERDKPIFIPVQSNFRDLVYALLYENGGLRHPVTNELLFAASKEEENSKGGGSGGGGSDESGGGGAPGVDGILLDFGVSSHQIDNADRGFAFMKDGPLDMRMSRGDSSSSEAVVGGGGFTAADICNEFTEAELKRIVRTYGDEPRAAKIAQSIINHRPLETTKDLMAAIADVTPQYAKKSKRMGRTATAARVFQSLRIVVNEEDVALKDVLMDVAPTMVRPGGRLVVLSYHSMEDRATKRVMRDGTLEKRGVFVERDLYGNVIEDGRSKRYWKPLGKKRKATEEEVEVNPRARSATLRVAERLDV